MRASSFGFTNNRLFMDDMVFYFFIGLLLLSILLFKKFKNFKGYLAHAAITMVLVVGLAFTAISSFNNYPEVYDCNDLTSTKQSPAKFAYSLEDPAYHALSIGSYKMDLNLEKNFSNYCTITVHNEVPDELPATLDFKLDGCFHVNKVLLNGTETKFERINEEYLAVSTAGAAAEKEMVMTFEYHGNVNYMNAIFIRNAFVDDGAAYLPETFAWYPRLDNKKSQIRYDLKIDAGNRIVSNLTGNAVVEQSGPYEISGTSDADIYLLSGYYKTATIDNRQITGFEDHMGSKQHVIALHLALQKKGNFPVYNRPFDTDSAVGEKLDPASLASKSVLILPYSYSIAYDSYSLEDCIMITEELIINS